MLSSSVVVIPLQRYNELLNIETRVDVVVERIAHDDYLKREDILWILGTDLAIDKAMELRVQDELAHKSYSQKYAMTESE